jgi:hypothetical protein
VLLLAQHLLLIIAENVLKVLSQFLMINLMELGCTNVEYPANALKLRIISVIPVCLDALYFILRKFVLMIKAVAIGSDQAIAGLPMSFVINPVLILMFQQVCIILRFLMTAWRIHFVAIVQIPHFPIQ